MTQMSHKNCQHPNTKSARAACRREMSKDPMGVPSRIEGPWKVYDVAKTDNTMMITDLMIAIRDYASQPENYEKGWDVIVEATTDEELLAEIGKCRTLKGALRKLAPSVKIREDYANDIRNA